MNYQMETVAFLNSLLTSHMYKALHFKKVIEEQYLPIQKVVIVIAYADNVASRRLANLVLPGANWKKHIDQGHEPLAIGLAWRKKVKKEINKMNPGIARKLDEIQGVAVVVSNGPDLDIVSI